jgi:glycosyltransferase involved in cell wall biosynthesis
VRTYARTTPWRTGLASPLAAPEPGGKEPERYVTRTVPAASTRPQVIHIATRYLRGGSERRIGDIVRAFPEADHHLVVGIDSDPELAREQLSLATITIVPQLVRDPNPLRDAAALRRLLTLLRRSPPDLVVTHQSKAGVLGRLAARRAGNAPVLHSLSMSSFGPGYPRWQDALFRRIEARLQRSTAAYAVVGSDLAHRYAAIGVPAEKLRIVRSGVRLPPSRLDGAARSSVRAELGVPRGRSVVAYVGSLDARKNVLALSPFLRRLLELRAAPRPLLVVAGDGPLRDALATHLRAEGLERDALLLGFLPDPAGLIAAADLMVLLSRAEGIPQVLVQAAAADTPFVAYDVDGARELLEAGADGAIAPLGDVEAAAAAAAELLERRAPGGGAIDLSSWRPGTITASYRRLLGSMLGVDGALATPSTAEAPAGGPRSIVAGASEEPA